MRRRKRIRRTSIMLVLALALGGAWLGVWRSTAQRPNILLILIDTLRADRVVPSPTGEDPMPFLSRLAAEAVFYERAHAPTSWTLPSIASLFTAQYPSQHRVAWWLQPIQTTEATLAGVLRSQGYVTGGFSAHAAIGPKHDLHQGFTTFQVVGEPKILKPPDAIEVNTAALEWIVSVADKTAPYFLYLHYMDVHTPYRRHKDFTAPRQMGVTGSDAQLSQNASKGAFVSESERRELWDFPPADQRRLWELYDGEARYLDHRLAELFAGLEERGALENTIVIVTADHGEEFGEHGVFGHATTLYETVLRVPLIVKLPNDSRPQRVTEPVQIGGLAPTLMLELNIEAPPDFRIPAFRVPGRSRTTASAPYIYAELLDTESLAFRLHGSAVVGPQGKLLVTPAGEEILFVDDPMERSPREDSPLAGELRAALHDTQRTFSATREREVQRNEIDELTVERLRRLGYEVED